MDVNATLTRLRELVAESDSPDAPTETLDELAATVHALDEWLSTGGFLPTQWQH